MVMLLQVDGDEVRLLRLLQLYIHEWSGKLAVPIREDALFFYDQQPYRDREVSAAFLFIDAEPRTPLGFALALRDPAGHWMVEDFFVIAGARRRGIGLEAAAALFAARPGRWTLTVRPENPDALHFWRRVASGANERAEVGGDGVIRTRLSFSSVPSDDHP